VEGAIWIMMEKSAKGVGEGIVTIGRPVNNFRY
jgi:hypothetical protein